MSALQERWDPTDTPTLSGRFPALNPAEQAELNLQVQMRRVATRLRELATSLDPAPLPRTDCEGWMRNTRVRMEWEWAHLDMDRLIGRAADVDRTRAEL